METYLFTHFSKQINKSVLFVPQVPIALGVKSNRMEWERL